MQDVLVELDQIALAYGKGAQATKAIEDVSLTIKKGEFIQSWGLRAAAKAR